MRCLAWTSSTASSPTSSPAVRTPPADSRRETALWRLGQVIQKLVGMLRARSFSMTLGVPNGQRAATRKGLGERPSWRSTASWSLKGLKGSLTVFVGDDVDLLSGFDHPVALAGGALDARGGVQLFYEPLLGGVVHLGLVHLLFERGDLGVALEDLLQGRGVGGKEKSGEGGVEHDHERPVSPGYAQGSLVLSYPSSPTVRTSTTFAVPGREPAVPPVIMIWSPSLRCPASSAASTAPWKRSSREPACSPWIEVTPQTSASIRTVCSMGLTARILLGGLKRATRMLESPLWVEVTIASASRSSASSQAAWVTAS